MGIKVKDILKVLVEGNYCFYKKDGSVMTSISRKEIDKYAEWYVKCIYTECDWVDIDIVETVEEL